MGEWDQQGESVTRPTIRPMRAGANRTLLSARVGLGQRSANGRKTPYRTVTLAAATF